jgi:hypothetical protein
VTLQRIVLTFKPGELVVHTLYRTQDGPSPNTKARTKEERSSPGPAYRTPWRPWKAAQSGRVLRDSPQGEDVLLATISSDAAKRVKGA